MPRGPAGLLNLALRLPGLSGGLPPTPPAAALRCAPFALGKVPGSAVLLTKARSRGATVTPSSWTIDEHRH
ncbi:MAG: hypothetical protein ACYC1D_14920 [Acidimicrobiales bacterium]